MPKDKKNTLIYNMPIKLNLMVGFWGKEQTKTLNTSQAIIGIIEAFFESNPKIKKRIEKKAEEVLKKERQEEGESKNEEEN
jgi:hypothetical protein